MKTTIKKITTPIIALFLVFACIFQLPTVSGKYTSTFNNLVGYISFSGSALADMFYITNPNGDNSKPLWGAAKEDDITADDIATFNGTKTINEQFPVYNATSEYMLIKFRISYTSSTNDTVPCGINNTNVDLVVDNNGENTIDLSHSYNESFRGTKSDFMYSWNIWSSTFSTEQKTGTSLILGWANYYMYTGTINPLNSTINLPNDTTFVDCFVVPPETSTYFQFKLDMSTVLGGYSSACYASIEMEAVPIEIGYDTNGTPSTIKDKQTNNIYDITKSPPELITS